MYDPSYPAYPIFAFLGFILVLVPLPWHLQAWNAGTCLYMIWTAIGCLNLFVNSIVWSHDAINRSPVWCDISSRIIVGVAVAIPAASLCINRRLYKIATVQIVSVSRASKRRDVIIDLSIGLTIPLVQMVLQYIVQGHRYNIWEQIGPYPDTYNTALAYPLTIIWPCVIGLISAVYCILTIRAFMQRRAQFSEFLSSNKSLTVNRYFRLMALATTELLFTTPISAYGIYLTATQSPLQPWISFSNVHFGYSNVDQFPAVEWRANGQAVVTLELSRWLMVVCAFVFFAFFGFADEARRQYGVVWRRLGFGSINPATRRFRIGGMRSTSGVRTIGSLPVYTPTKSTLVSSYSASTLESPISEYKVPSSSVDDVHFVSHAV